MRAGEHLAEREAAVEPIGELGKVPRQVLGAQVVIRAMQRALDVAQDGVDPGERRMPDTCWSTSLIPYGNEPERLRVSQPVGDVGVVFHVNP